MLPIKLVRSDAIPPCNDAHRTLERVPKVHVSSLRWCIDDDVTACTVNYGFVQPRQADMNIVDQMANIGNSSVGSVAIKASEMKQCSQQPSAS